MPEPDLALDERQEVGEKEPKPKIKKRVRRTSVARVVNGEVVVTTEQIKNKPAPPLGPGPEPM